MDCRGKYIRGVKMPKTTERLRKLLLSLDLKTTHSLGEAKLADEDFNLHSKLKGKYHKRLAVNAKMAREMYNIHAVNIANVRKKVQDEIQYCIRGYPEKYQRIWIGYFLEGMTREELASECDYSVDRIAHIIVMLRKDLNDYEETANEDIDG